METVISPRVQIVKAGSLVRDAAGEILDARSTVSLILAGDRRILVDTGLPGEGKLVLERLAVLSVGPEDVDTVVNTHLHVDHCGNNHLFPRAKLLSGLREGTVIAPGVEIIETPGHTLDHISVVCEGDLTTVMAGDALPVLGNFQKGVPPRIHVDREMALASMDKIVSKADIVVPGHDGPFCVKERAYTTLPGLRYANSR